jgi:hypothetical protein
MRAGPVGGFQGNMMMGMVAPTSVKSPRKERTKLPDISENQQRSLFNALFVSTTEPRRYLRVVGFTQKQLIVEELPSSATGEIDRNWLSGHPVSEPVGKSMPGQRARLTSENGQLILIFRSQKFTRQPSPTAAVAPVPVPSSPPIPSPKSPGSPRPVANRGGR